MNTIERIKHAHSTLVVAAIESSTVGSEELKRALVAQENDVMRLMVSLHEYRAARQALDLDMSRANLHRLNKATALIDQHEEAVANWKATNVKTKTEGE